MLRSRLLPEPGHPQPDSRARQHVEALLAGEHKLPICVGGAKSEQNWREEFRQAGLPVREPVIMDSTASARNSSSVEVGISRVYAAISTNQLKFFGDLAGILDELESYSRVTNEKGEVSDEIEDKSTWHSCDALRYIIGHLRRPMNTKFEMHSGGGIKYPKGVFDSHADPSLKSDNKALERRRQARGRTASFDDVNW